MKRPTPRPEFREIIVKLHEGQDLVGGVGLLQYGGESLPSLLGVAPDTVRQSFPRTVAQRRASVLPLRLPGGKHSLDLFVRVRVPADEDVREPLGQLWERDDVVEAASVAMIPRPATMTVQQIQGLEQFLEPRPIGVNALGFWPLVDMDATLSGTEPRLRVAVCDFTYFAGHPDLAHVAYIPDGTASVPPGGPSDDVAHGTASLGVVGARQPVTTPVEGARGIAYGAGLHFSTTKDVLAGWGYDVPAALDRAVSLLGPGDVILLEWDLWPLTDDPFTIVSDDGNPPDGFPAEADPDVFLGILVAQDDGITVVQPAGNGNGSLAVVTENQTSGGSTVIWNPALNRSGAITVGAGDLSTGVGRVHTPGTNFGLLVDCHSWGSGVVAPTGASDPGALDMANPGDPPYTGSFDGTSAASAIVAGVVAGVQWTHLQRTDVPALPEELRLLVREDANGEPQEVNDALDFRVGPQPDLVAAAATIPPRSVLYQRDLLTDLGQPPEPDAELHWRLPDLVVSRPGAIAPALADPTALDTPDSWMQEYPPTTIRPDTVVIPRARNRGPGMPRARVHVFWSEPAAVLHPFWWKSVGRSSFTNVAPNEVVLAEPAIPWPSSDLPTGDFASLISVLVPVGTPFSAPGPHLSTMEYRTLIRQLNVRCLNVQRRLVKRGEAAGFAFRFRGLPDAAARHQLRIRSDLPPGTALTVGVDQLLQTENGVVVATPSAPVGGVLELAESLSPWFRLLAKQEIVMEIQIELPPLVKRKIYSLRIDQLMASSSTGKAWLGGITFLVDGRPPQA